MVDRYKDKFPALASQGCLKANLQASGFGYLIAGRGRGGDGMQIGAMRESIKLYEAGRYQEAAAILDRHQISISSEMQELQAWAHYNAAANQIARKIFAELKQKRSGNSVEHGEFLTEIQARGNPHRWWYN